MIHRDIVTIGGSAGAIPALEKLIAGLAPDFPAAVFIVVHTAASPRAGFPELINQAGALHAVAARDGATFEPGWVYVAPADTHLLLLDGGIALRRGARENMSRPAIDPLFRSAACEFGPRVIGVLLSGKLYDGASGLRAIKRCGGVTVVQDPADALYPEMPQNALDRGVAEHCVMAGELSKLLTRLVAEPVGPRPAIPDDIRLEARMAAKEIGGPDEKAPPGRLAPLSCPDCGGSLWEIDDGGGLRYRCHVGHAYDAHLLLNGQSEIIERALWSALRAHRERSAVLLRLAEAARDRQNSLAARRWEDLAAEHERDAGVIQNLVSARSAPEISSINGDT
jgi:two-component system, chemotaxis family, protein-glutamate methylesterase/glutaminase